MRYIGIGLTFTMLWVSVGCGASKRDLAALQPISATERAQWEPFVPESEAFSIVMPGVPTEVKTDADAGAVKQRSFMLKARQGQYKAAYLISYADFPPEQRGILSDAAILESSWQSSRNDVNNKMIYKKQIKYKQYEGIEYQYRGEKDRNYLVTSRDYLIRNRLYMTSAIMSQEQFDRGDAVKYLNSFELTR